MLKPIYHILREKNAKTGKCGVPLKGSDFLNVLGDEYTARNYQNGISDNMPCTNCYGLGEIAILVTVIARAMSVSDECPECGGIVTMKYSIRATVKAECDTCKYNLII